MLKNIIGASVEGKISGHDDEYIVNENGNEIDIDGLFQDLFVSADELSLPDKKVKLTISLEIEI